MVPPVPLAFSQTRLCTSVSEWRLQHILQPPLPVQTPPYAVTTPGGAKKMACGGGGQVV
jgi:hypothetical protein